MSTRVYGVAKNGATMKIELTEVEDKICKVLQGVSELIAQKRPDLPKIESRIAGGWVRDKLLGNECNDLDVAVNDMMGYEFATFVNEHLKNQGVATRNIAKIDSNPEKSKHLETATTKLFDRDVDFCNLRTEAYEPDSRIPSQITFGTPTEDAYRRDITINSLFYNVNTNEVEDFTERGIHDLIYGIIRTPLEPFETFHDDPLRVLRCIRFASRFNFQMTPELCEAAKHPQIKNALIHKISRERIGTEFDKMISGPHPLLALELIQQLELYPIVMKAPEDISSGTVGSDQMAVDAVGAVTWLEQQETALKSSSKAEKRTMFLTASVLPFLGVTVEQKKRFYPGVQSVLRDSIKTNNADIKTVSSIFQGIPVLVELAKENTQRQIKRAELGMVIRELKETWKTAIKCAAIKELLDVYPNAPWTNPKEIQIDNGVCQKYVDLIKRAEEYGITNCYEWKHLINGKRVAEVVGVRPGPDITGLLEVQMKWQLDNPDGTIEECEKMLSEYWANKKR
ncbi:hypothetical protein G6F70_000029 [Rhizopus microsporus]|uniref:CCA tRNA nucleotidyltransferase, mitochondrial n=2 Tax=Rhizopus TaxID=4842 RepID=A0A367JTR6_RHIAZ|nr:hypothetical protein G6F71_001373 [Rhizopus microsporus]RCH93308.1 CCA tRNA nucleotidyltransferase, mitochondrial [Rhizopus azygosporus]KAG1204892.1 hypothetical protein G6F70_000029 [Rhizopus microsporus]KAG1216498.1 hypothetical protein G6F69_000069 [Rhizopus microsporus]KAG1238748.1 hypothetical protein G6F67_000223 [Rhizopus microsporus]